MDDVSLTRTRLAALLDRLGLARCHVAGCMSGDWGGLVDRHSDRIASLAIVAPHLNSGVPEGFAGLAAPVLVLAGDRGAPAERAQGLIARRSGTRLVEFAGYESPMWADTVADNPDATIEAMFDLFAEAEAAEPLPSADLPAGQGEHAGLYFRISGSGPPLLLLPLSLAPSQWRPIEEALASRYCIIVVGGAQLGAVALIEARADSGYGDLAAQLIARAAPEPGARVLELGCGSGPLARRLARETAGGCAIVAADLNAHLLSEARRLAEAEGLTPAIDFVEANGEALGLPDGTFDVAYCCTVFEEGNADRMIGELARVVRPGGRIVAMTRCIDVEWWANFDVPDALKRRIDASGPAVGSGLGPGGCADASLYTRLGRQGLDVTFMGPQFAIYRPGRRLEDVLDRLVAPLDAADAEQCREAIALGRANRTLFVAEPFHCAVAVKPPGGA